MARDLELERQHAFLKQVQHRIVVALAKDHLVGGEADLRRRAGKTSLVLGPELGDERVRRRAATAGFEITPSMPRAVGERVGADVALYAPLIREGRVSRL